MIFARSKVRPRRSRVFALFRKIEPSRLQYYQPMRALVEDERRICGFAGREQRKQQQNAIDHFSSSSSGIPAL